MYKTHWLTSILLLAVIGFAPVKAEVNVENGKQLHELKCASCHATDGSMPYPKLIKRDIEQRKVKRKIANYGSLNTQVQACATNLNIDWFPEDVANVAAYLNAEYYKFETETSPASLTKEK